VCANGFAHPLSYRAPDLDVIFSIMWHAEPLLVNDREENN
jgi:hypothetical protein